ncbi:MAG: hypothetical protein ACI8RZ_007297 [Myxococcota bacterium]|jgi:hypothetical protein
MLLLIAIAAAQTPTPTLIDSVQAALADAYVVLAEVEVSALEVSSDAVQCVASRRQSIEALDGVAQSSIAKFGTFMAAGADEEATHEQRKLAIILNKVPEFAELAKRCLKPEEPYAIGLAPFQPEPTGPDPTDRPAYYALDDQGWVEGAFQTRSTGAGLVGEVPIDDWGNISFE